MVRIKNISRRSILNYDVSINPGEIIDVDSIDPVIIDRIEILTEVKEIKTKPKKTKEIIYSKINIKDNGGDE